jgi:hypothetical protein
MEIDKNTYQDLVHCDNTLEDSSLHCLQLFKHQYHQVVTKSYHLKLLPGIVTWSSVSFPNPNPNPNVTLRVDSQTQHQHRIPRIVCEEF